MDFGIGRLRVGVSSIVRMAKSLESRKFVHGNGQHAPRREDVQRLRDVGGDQTWRHGQERISAKCVSGLGVIVTTSLAWVAHTIPHGNKLFGQCVSCCQTGRRPVRAASNPLLHCYASQHLMGT